MRRSMCWHWTWTCPSGSGRRELRRILMMIQQWGERRTAAMRMTISVAVVRGSLSIIHTIWPWPHPLKALMSMALKFVFKGGLMSIFLGRRCVNCVNEINKLRCASSAMDYVRILDRITYQLLDYCANWFLLKLFVKQIKLISHRSQIRCQDPFEEHELAVTTINLRIKIRCVKTPISFAN